MAKQHRGTTGQRTAICRTARTRLLIGTAGVALASLALPQAATAQLSGLPVNVRNTTVRPGTAVAPVRPASMQQAIERQAAREARAVQMRQMTVNFRDAALAATRNQPTDGISDNGLNPIAPIRDIFDGRTTGVDNINAALAAAAAAATSSGSGQGWVGVNVPTQTVSNGAYAVDIVQTQQNAIATWQKFDVGANTSVNFVQRNAAGTVQSDWTVVNRVVSTEIAPSTILGRVTADANVVVLNRGGVIFGQNAQVNLRSLVASSLDIGNQSNAGTALAVELAARNQAFLNNGLFALNTQGPGATVPYFLSSLRATEPNQVDGGIFIDPGARISAASGGYLLFAGPLVENRGWLSAVNGQVSLQGGRRITAAASTGADDSIDPSVRGFIFRTVSTARNALVQTPLVDDDGAVFNDGLIESRRGYISLGAGITGSVTNAGYLGATTSVSRNGKIELTAGTVTLAGSEDPLAASAVVILPDEDGATTPVGTAAEPNNFRASEIVIGVRVPENFENGGGVQGVGAAERAGEIVPGQVIFGENSFLRAPGATVSVGRRFGQDGSFSGSQSILLPSFVDVRANALIDVSGIKDFEKSVADNILRVTPVKRNELRDTPTYREVAIGDEFTLNGETLLVDVRQSGVRADGVAWIGSPLIEAASLAGQIPVTAGELMTVGGTVSLATNAVTTQNLATYTAAGVDLPFVRIAEDATIDFSGGWVNYVGGAVITSRLLTADGRSVDIAAASPNDNYVDVINGVDDFVSKNGVVATASQSLLTGQRVEAGYDEGRDAGALSIAAPQFEVAGAQFDGAAYAGLRQRLGAQEASADSGLASDPRKLQADRFELPSAGLLSIGFARSDDTVGLTRAVRIVADGTDTSGSPASILIDRQINSAGLGALQIQTTGGITLDADAAFAVAPGGAVDLVAGRTIRLDGAITAASGSISAATYQLGDQVNAVSSGGLFDSSDDIPAFLPPGSDAAPYDILVGGTLNVAGLWTNDRLDRSSFTGSAWRDGGSVTLRVAPRVLLPSTANVLQSAVAIDLSGSILIDPDARIDVRAGGYVAADGALLLDAAGGDVALINETIYPNFVRTGPDTTDGQGGGSKPLDGANQSVEFTPVLAGPALSVVPGLVPEDPRAEVSFAAGNFLGFGFAGGGTFTLVAPEVSFGSASPAPAHIGFDFFQETGFGTLDVESFGSRIRDNLFADDFLDAARTTPRVGSSAFFSTTSFRIRSGESFDLTQSLLPSLLDAATVSALRGTASAGSIGAAVTGQGRALDALLTPSVPVSAFDRVAANLTLGGLTELVVDAGGTLTGAAGATIRTPKLLNEGRIDIRGGVIQQDARLPSLFANAVLPTRGTTQAGLAAVFDGNGDGVFSENEANAAGITGAGGAVLTNRQLLTTAGADRFIVFEGVMGFGDGIVLGDGSVTDLGGTILFDPRAPLRADGNRVRTGRLVAGGSIGTAAEQLVPNDRLIGPVPDFGADPYSLLLARTFGRPMEMEAGATLNLDGASGVFDVRTISGGIVSLPQWTDAGTLSNLSGLGSVAAGTISAKGGDARAAGGTFVWSNPTLYNPVGAATASGAVAVNQIEGAGFDLFVAQDSVTFADNVDLTLGRGFILQSGTPFNGQPGSQASLVVGLLADASATVRAPRIVFDSAQDRFESLFYAAPSATAGQLAFIAGNGGIDFFGATRFNETIGSTLLESTGDVRFSGTELTGTTASSLFLNGEILAWGDLTFNAARVYATTGTGNLQRIIESILAGTAIDAVPFQVTALNGSTIRFLGDHVDAAPATPLSAGSYVRFLADSFEQGGYLAAPLGAIEIGSGASPSFLGQPLPAAFLNAQFVRTQNSSSGDITPSTVRFLPGSTTSVSAAGLSIPYGTTLDTTDYFFTPTGSLPLTAVPTGQIFVAAPDVQVTAGARVNLSGGGDIFGFEFVSGVGGSRNVLDRFNSDVFSSNGYDPATGVGYQFADQRQVFALVPVASAQVAPFDPIYSDDYSGADRLLNPVPVDLYTLAGGLSVTIRDGTAGLAAGEYLLLPAQYALLPGGYRIYENTGAAVAAVGSGATTLLDGSIVVNGVYSSAFNDQQESQLRSFTIQPRASILSYSNIVTTPGSDAIVDQAAVQGIVTPRVAADAGRLVLSNLTQLRVAGLIDTNPAASGRGAQVDIAGTAFAVRAAADQSQAGVIQLTNATLDSLNAGSLFIGGTRSANADGSTSLNVTATAITVAGDAAISGPETLLAVQGATSRLTIEDGAQILAANGNADTSSSDYVLAAAPGGAIRVASGAERQFARDFDDPAVSPAIVTIGAALLGEAAGADAGLVSNVAIESSRDAAISDGTTIAADRVALISDSLSLGGGGLSGTVFDTLSQAQQLTLRSNSSISFAAQDTPYSFANVVLDARSIRAADAGGAVEIAAEGGSVTFRNSAADFAGCTVNCAATGTLAIDAATLVFDRGVIGIEGFAGGADLTGRSGVYVEGKGTLDAGTAALTLRTPFVADRAAAVDPREQAVRPDYRFATTGAIALRGTAADGTLLDGTIGGNAAPGARIAFGNGDSGAASFLTDGTDVRASAGVIDINARGDVQITGGATLAVPSFSRSFGDDADRVTVTVGNGTVSLTSRTGDILLDEGSRIAIDDGVGEAGALRLIASRGTITQNATISPAATGTRTASLTWTSGTGGFDLGGFITDYGSRFGGDLAIETGEGDLALLEDQILRATSVLLSASAGRVLIDGTIDTRGTNVGTRKLYEAVDLDVNGGDVALFGQTGVTLGASALIDTRTSGYHADDTRVASAGDVTIGIGTAGGAAIDIASGAAIDTRATRTEALIGDGLTGHRLIATDASDGRGGITTGYILVEPDKSGDVAFRAPVVDNLVDIRLNGSNPVAGAGVTDVNGNALVSMEVEAYKVWDLDAIAALGAIDGQATGLSLSNGTLSVAFTDNALTSDGLTRNASGQIVSRNLFGADYNSGGIQSVVNFVRTFDVAATDGSDLSAMLLRPGFEFRSQNDVVLASNWNLAAGTFGIVQPGDTTTANPVYGQRDQSAYTNAIADGLLARLTTLNAGNRRDSNDGNTAADTGAAATWYVALTEGSEAEFFENNVYMLYRVGNTAAGAAPVVSFRTAGSFSTSAPAPADVTQNAVGYSITDGFFTFDDRTDPFYTAIQYNSEYGNGSTPDPIEIAPFSNRANSSGALGGLRPTSVTLAANGRTISAISATSIAQGNGIDPAVVFPLLNNNADFAASSDIRIVAGAGFGANPDAVDNMVSADLNVTGERSYLAVGNFDGRVGVGGSSNSVILYGERAFVYAPVVLRTGTGDLNLAAAGDINSFRRSEVQFRDAFGSQPVANATDPDGNPLTYQYGTFEQVGGNAIYTVGHRALIRQALAEAGTTDVSFALAATYASNGNSIIDSAVGSPLETGSFTSNLANLFFRDPLLLEGGGAVELSAAGSIVGRRDGARDAALFATPNEAPTDAISIIDRFGNVSFVDIRINLAEALNGDRNIGADRFGEAGDLTRVGLIGNDTRYGIAAHNFSAGVAALGGGDIDVSAGSMLSNLTVTLASSAATANARPAALSGLFNSTIATASAMDQTTFTSPVLAMFGAGDAAIDAAALQGLNFSISSGTADISSSGDIGNGLLGSLFGTGSGIASDAYVVGGDYLRDIEPTLLRLANARISISARGSLSSSVPTAITSRAGGLSGQFAYPAAGNMTAIASADFSAIGDVQLIAQDAALVAPVGAQYSIFDQAEYFLAETDLSRGGSPSGFSNSFGQNNGSVLPAQFGISSVSGNVGLARVSGIAGTFVGDYSFMQLPSAIGHTSIFANGDINDLALAASDSRRAVLPGPLSSYESSKLSLPFGFPITYADATFAYLNLVHDSAFPRVADPTLNRIFANGDMVTASIFMPEATRITAGGDIIDMIFFGQNIRTSDVTRIVAGGNILASTNVNPNTGLPFYSGNHFEISGPGLFSLEAGGDVGPFLTSGTFGSRIGGNVASPFGTQRLAGPYAGGIVSVGNQTNPFLPDAGANIDLLFGVVFGADFAGLADAYLNPANGAALDGDLFVQIVDADGNATPDRTRPIYAPILAGWLRTNEPELFAALFDPADFPDDEAGNAALAEVAYGAQQQLFDAFSGLDSFRQRQFLTQQLYFNELAAPSDPNGPSFNQFIRAYRAVDYLFPADRGYTNNLAAYGSDGLRLTGADGQPVVPDRVQTGNADLRLSTVQTLNGGTISVLGPGGDLLVGSVVRTSEQAARRDGIGRASRDAVRVLGNIVATGLFDVPVGLEGLLTFNGGDINSFTDGSLRLNQSRLFTLAGGDIRAFSANGDLNAGQGPKTSANFPPVVVNFDFSGLGEVDPRGNVAGAGIGAFGKTDDAIALVAPVGTVDAGDAGVRASGSIFVAAARVANADSFSAGGSISGVPALATTAVAAPVADPGKAVADAVSATTATTSRSRVEVSVLGYAGGDPCDDPARANDPECRTGN